jgi:hypothetical protein
MLQVPEQYAGQAMKCPLCAGQFTVPALPQMPPAPAMAASSAAAGGGPGLGGAVPSPSREPMPPPRGGEKFDGTAIPPPPQPTASQAPPPPEGYTHTQTLTLKPQVVSLLAPVFVGLIFILMFFPWVGLYPAGEAAGSQSGWGAGWGSFEPDTRWLRANREMGRDIQSSTIQPGISLLALLFTLVFCLLILPVSGLVAVVGRVPLNLPPAVQPLLPWRAAMLAGLVLLGFVLLLMQSLVGFSLEAKMMETAERVTPALSTPDPTPDDRLTQTFKTAQIYSSFGLQTTIWFRLVLLFHILALIGAGIDFWLERRGTQPLPRADVMW